MALVHGDPGDAIDILTAEHAQIRAMLRELEIGEEKRAVAEELFHLLELHFSLEDTLLYPSLHGPAKFDDSIPAHGRDAHRDIQEKTAWLKGVGPEGESFRLASGRFSEALGSHFADEEENIFPIARERLGVTLLKIAAEMRVQEEEYWRHAAGAARLSRFHS